MKCSALAEDRARTGTSNLCSQRKMDAQIQALSERRHRAGRTNITHWHSSVPFRRIATAWHLGGTECTRSWHQRQSAFPAIGKRSATSLLEGWQSSRIVMPEEMELSRLRAENPWLERELEFIKTSASAAIGPRRGGAPDRKRLSDSQMLSLIRSETIPVSAVNPSFPPSAAPVRARRERMSTSVSSLPFTRFYLNNSADTQVL